MTEDGELVVDDEGWGIDVDVPLAKDPECLALISLWGPMGYREISALTGLTVQQVRDIEFRAMRRLRHAGFDPREACRLEGDEGERSAI